MNCKAKYLLVAALLSLSGFNSRSQNLQSPFDNCRIHGSITIYDLKNNKWIYSDKADAHRASLPASTFKIINSLIALETSTIENELQTFKWDSIPRQVDAWNHDSDMEQAFKNSTVWFYVKLAEKIDRQKYSDFLKKSNYGNNNLREKGTDFWNFGKFRISPVNQIRFLVKLYKQELPFSKRNIEIVKRIMINETTPDYTLRAKTGWTNYGGTSSGWWIGYVERKDNTYFFATRIFKPASISHPNFSACRKEITFNVLKQLKIIP